MTDETDTLTIETNDAPPVVVEGDGDAPPKIVKPEDGIEALRALLDAERAARQAAEQRANEASRSAATSANAAQDSDLALVTNAIATVKLSQDALKAQYRDALAAQDYDRASDINSEMTNNAAKLLRLDEGKTQLEAKPKAEPQRYQPTDPVEAMVSTLTAPSAAWVRAHPEYARDPAKTQRMLAAHNLAVTDGLAPDTPEYFEAIEETLRIKRPAPVQEQQDEALSEAARPSPQRAPPAAPVTRGGGSQTSVRLSAEEREMAGMMNMTPEAYAAEKVKLLKEQGKLN